MRPCPHHDHLSDEQRHILLDSHDQVLVVLAEQRDRLIATLAALVEELRGPLAEHSETVLGDDGEPSLYAGFASACDYLADKLAVLLSGSADGSAGGTAATARGSLPRSQSHG